MEITGKLIKVLEETRGESARGPWVRGGFVIETDGDYPRQVAFDCFGEDRVSMVKAINPGVNVTVRFNPESREFNNKWYTNLRCQSIHAMEPGAMPPASTGYSYATPTPTEPVQRPTVAAAPAAPSTEMPQSTDDLPF